MEQSNRTPYAEYVKEINRIWGEPLFAEPAKLGASRLDGYKWHPRLRRRVDRKREVSLRQVLREERDGKDDAHAGNPAVDGLARMADAHARGKK